MPRVLLAAVPVDLDLSRLRAELELHRQFAQRMREELAEVGHITKDEVRAALHLLDDGVRVLHPE